MKGTWRWLISGSFVGNSTLERILEVCRTAGLAGIEGASSLFAGMTDSELEKIGAQFASSGLAVETFHLPYADDDDVASFYETTRAGAVESMKRWISRAAALGARVCILHPTPNRRSVDVEGVDPYLSQLGRSLESLLPEAEGLGITIALENMVPSVPGRFCSRPEHLAAVGERFYGPHFGMCLDTGHAHLSGGAAALDAFLDVMQPHLVALHLQDNAGDRDSHLAPGHGTIDWGRLFRRLEEMSFSRAACIEAPPFAPGPSYSLESWTQMVDEIELLLPDVPDGT